jgi:hypothetical protein
MWRERDLMIQQMSHSLAARNSEEVAKAVERVQVKAVVAAGLHGLTVAAMLYTEDTEQRALQMRSPGQPISYTHQRLAAAEAISLEALILDLGNGR